MSCSEPDRCLEQDAFFNKKQMIGPEAKPFILDVRFKQTEFSVGQTWAAQGGQAQQWLPGGPGHRPSHLLFGPQRLTLSECPSSWLAWFTYLSLGHQLPLGCRGRLDQGTCGGSNGLSSFQNLFFKIQGLVCLLEQKKMTSHAIRIHEGCFLPNYLLLGHLALHLFMTFLSTPR